MRIYVLVLHFDQLRVDAVMWLFRRIKGKEESANLRISAADVVEFRDAILERLVQLLAYKNSRVKYEYTFSARQETAKM